MDCNLHRNVKQRRKTYICFKDILLRTDFFEVDIEKCYQQRKKSIYWAILKIKNLCFFNIFIDYAITVVPFPHLTPLHPAHPLPPTFPPYSSCPWVILISSLASTFPTLFLPSPCLFSTCHLCHLFSVPFPPSPPPTPLLTTLHVISISMVLFLF